MRFHLFDKWRVFCSKGGKQLQFSCDSNCHCSFAHRRLNPAGRSAHFLSAAAVLLCLCLPHTRTSPNRPHAAIMLTYSGTTASARVFSQRGSETTQLQIAAAHHLAAASAIGHLPQVGGHQQATLRSASFTPGQTQHVWLVKSQWLIQFYVN